jgi:23S rRNA (guanosine2251-2'-O)-methyltransferase
MSHPQTPTEFVFGMQSVKETLLSEKEIERVYIQKSTKSDGIREVLALARERKVEVWQVPVEKLNRITQKNHQGVICYISPIHYVDVENVIQTAFENGENPLIIVLDEVTDVRNFGAIVRTALCAGAHAVLFPEKGSARIGSDAMKTSSGALNHLPICRTKNLVKSLKILKESGLSLIACSEKGDQTIFDVDMSGPTAIIMGSEERGIKIDHIAEADHFAKIPMTGKVQSMNVGVAMGIISFEAVRQRIQS